VINKKNTIEWKIISSIKRKMIANQLTIAKADKGKTITILIQDEYKQRIKTFIQENNFGRISNNPTQQYEKEIKQTVKQSKNIMQKEETWKYTNMNPTAPSMHATIKLHKLNIPIRPIINCRNATGYKLAKHLAKLLHNYFDLPYTYNVRNSIHLMTDLKTIELNNNIRICLFDIENMYRNIPKKEIINITNNVLENNIEIEVSTPKEIIQIMRIIMRQNCFQFDQQYYEQTEGLAMGAPISAIILAELFIQYMEHK
jgi:hypothetical protein